MLAGMGFLASSMQAAWTAAGGVLCSAWATITGMDGPAWTIVLAAAAALFAGADLIFFNTLPRLQGWIRRKWGRIHNATLHLGTSPDQPLLLGLINLYDAPDRMDKAEVVVRASRRWWWFWERLPEKKVLVLRASDSAQLGISGEVVLPPNAPIAPIPIRLSEWLGDRLPSRKCDMFITLELGVKHRLYRQRHQSIESPETWPQYLGPSPFQHEPPAAQRPPQPEEAVEVVAPAQPLLFDVETAPVVSNDFGGLWLALEIRNPTNQPILGCAGRVSEYRILSDGEVQIDEDMQGHLFAWSTATGEGGRTSTNIRGRHPDVLDLTFVPNRESAVFFHAGRPPGGDAYAGIKPREPGIYEFAVDLSALSGPFHPTRIWVPIRFRGQGDLVFLVRYAEKLSHSTTRTAPSLAASAAGAAWCPWCRLVSLVPLVS